MLKNVYGIECNFCYILTSEYYKDTGHYITFSRIFSINWILSVTTKLQTQRNHSYSAA